MDNIEDFLFWRIAYYFITKQEYRLIQLSKDQKELWLEKRENKRAQVIRLFRYNLDWSNWMQRDIQRTAVNGEAIRKQITRGECTVLNLYLSAFLPVDDYEFRIKEPFVHPVSKKTVVKTTIIDKESYADKLEFIGAFFGDSISIPSRTDYLEEEVEQLKQASITSATNQLKKEKALFEYGKPFFTYVFIIIQVAMFLVLEFSGGSKDSSTLIQFGAKFNPLILEGEWWRFFTPIFLHIGLLHLLMNTLALYYLGIAVEKIYGNTRFLFIYLLAGFSGSLASFIFSPNLSAGASGAIFGCFGALLYFGLIYPKLFFRTMGFNILVVLVINLSFGFTLPGIDNAGHIGGLIGGFLATGIVHFPKKRNLRTRLLFFTLTVVLTGSLLRFGYESPEAVVNEQSLLILSQDYIKSEEYEKAYSTLSGALSEDNHSAEFYFLLSFTEIKMGFMDNAKQHLLKTIEMKPSFHEAHYNLALVYLDERQIAKAREHVGKAMEIKPNQKEYKELQSQIGS